MRNYVKRGGIGGRRDNGAPIDTQYFVDRSIPDPITGCWNWTKSISKVNGYASVRRDGKTIGAHRASFEAATGKTLPSNIDACHECDNRRCVNPAHIFEGTRKVNMQDCSSKGRTRTPVMSGEACPSSKLTSEQVIAIRLDTRSQRAIGRAYGVARATIARVRNNMTWRSV